MTIEKLELQEFIGFCASEAEKRKWFAGAQAFAEGLQNLQRERDKALAARDQAFADRTAALAEIDAKRAKYERDIQTALEDLARVTKEKSAAAAKERGQADYELTTLKTQTEAARQAAELLRVELEAYREEAAAETAGITARLQALRAEESAAKSRFAGVVAALKG